MVEERILTDFPSVHRCSSRFFVAKTMIGYKVADIPPSWVDPVLEKRTVEVIRWMTSTTEKPLPWRREFCSQDHYFTLKAHHSRKVPGDCIRRGTFAVVTSCSCCCFSLNLPFFGLSERPLPGERSCGATTLFVRFGLRKRCNCMLMEHASSDLAVQSVHSSG